MITRLEAINEVLAPVGLGPVTNIDNPEIIEASIASIYIDRATREVCTQRMYSNTQILIELSPDENGFIYPPANATTISVKYQNGINTINDPIDFEIRNYRLFNLRDNTYEWTEPVQATISYLISFEDLNLTVQDYIVKKAKRAFNRDQQGNLSIDRLLYEDEIMALATLNREDTNKRKPNQLKHNLSANQIVSRAYNPFNQNM